MNVLVAYSSRHGAVAEISQSLGERIRNAGHEVTVSDVEAALDVRAYGAVVLGSSIYMGKWLKPARRFLEANALLLRARPTWLFSSGPIGDPPAPEGDPPEVEAFMQQVAARGHRTFAGKLDKGALGPVERLAVNLVHASDGDYRDWPAVTAWGEEIARALADEVR